LKKITSATVLCLLVFPVLLQATPVDFPHIKKFAELSNVTYSGETSAKEVILKQGGQLIRYKNLPDSQVTYVLSMDSDNKAQIIAIRGTANLENVLVDLSIKLQHDEVLNISLHQGFASAAKAVYDDVTPFLKNGLETMITGHSLGGAIAVILDMHLDKDSYPLGTVITFGQPKVTNVSGALKYSQLRIIRVVTPLDIVPIVPPLDPIDIKNPDIFWHLGKEIILLDGPNYSVTSGITSMLRAAKFFKQVPDMNNLESHRMLLYLELIDAKIDSATEVPFKNEVDFLNLIFP
jgi:triacylglycerol lipase